MNANEQEFDYFQSTCNYNTIPMKRFRTNIENGGIPTDRFDQEIPDDLICKMCCNVVKTPLECSQCGVLICTGCLPLTSIRAIFSSETNQPNKSCCPVCKTLNKFRNTSRVLSRIINELKLCCKNKDKGCEVIIMLGDLKNHENSCDFKTVKCGNLRYCTNRGTIQSFLSVVFGDQENDFNYLRTTSYVCSEKCKKMIVFD